MPSRIPGFEYDIFISYRQKDNKYDGWVTAFVQNLQKELDATFKEDISIYFDENPHDGLLDTHDVDESLREKLKCLIFIPVVSRTYCDPSSFAWNHELIPFIQMASRDGYGLKVKLLNGNTASRILPIRIHHLESEDVSLFEKETGGVLRPVDFIFKSSGVNRPLRADEDHPQDNLNKTYYRDQINKVANAVKDIVEGTLHANGHPKKSSGMARDQERGVTPPAKRQWLIAGIFALILLSAVIGWTRYGNSGDHPMATPEKQSIAVIPFRNLNETKENEVICNSIAEDILTKLAGLPELKVPSRISSNAYKNSDKTARMISQELGVRYILEGSVLANEMDLIITARLIDAEEDAIIWTKPFNRKLKDYFKVQGEVAQSVITSLQLNLQGREKELANIDQFDINAYELYKTGLHNFDHGGSYPTLGNIVPFFEEALKIDSTLYPAYVGLANAYITYNYFGRTPAKDVYAKVKEALERCRAIKPDYPQLYSALAAVALNFEYDTVSFKRYNDVAIRLDPNNPDIYDNRAMFHTIAGRFEDAYKDFDKAIELDPAKKIWYNYTKAFTYYLARDYSGALRIYDECLVTDPQSNYALWGKGLVQIQLGEYDKAIDTFHRRTAGTNTNWALANAYSKLGDMQAVNNILNYNVNLTRIQYVSPVLIGHLYLAANNKEEACRWFMRHVEDLDGGIFWFYMIRLDPRMDEMKTHPCYDRLLKQLPL